MNKKSIRIISTLLTIAIVLMALASTSFALNNPADLKGNTANVNLNTIENTGSKIVGILRTVGMVVAVIIVMVLGIKYMMGSSEEKASYKKTMMPYIVGAVLLFGASTIAGMVFDFADAL